MSTDRTILRLGKQDDGRFVSSEEFAEAEFDEPWHFEREDGRLIVMAPDSKEHDDCSEPFRDHLGAYKLFHPQIVDQVVSEAWVRVQGGTDRIPDIAVYLVGDRPDPPRPDRIPAMAFEIVSPDKESRDRDYIVKRAEYHRLGVREYVIIDRFQQTVTVLTFAPNGYDERILTVGDRYESPLLPGFSVRLSDVF
jgi:Uma2 family endonuclease